MTDKPDTLPTDPKAYMPGIAAEGDCTIDGDPLCEWCNERIDARDGGVWFHSGSDQRRCPDTQAQTLPDASAKPGPSQGQTQAQTDPEAYCADCGAIGVDADHTCDIGKDEVEIIVLARLPYFPSSFMNCCSGARVEVWPDLGASDVFRQLRGRSKPLASFGPDTHVVVRHIHSDSCETVRYMP